MDEYVPSAGSAPVQQVATDWLGSKRRAKNAKYEAQYNADMANWQFQNQIDLMNYQNAYNSPVEQMARYEAAGINPNLVAGNADAGNMSSPASVPDGRTTDTSKVTSPLDDIAALVNVAGQLASVGSGIQGFAKTAADIQNTQAATDLSRLQKILERGRFDIDLGRFQMDKTTRESQDAMLLAQLRQQLMDNATYYARFHREGALNDAQIRKINSDIQRSDELLPFEKESMRLRNVFQGYENQNRKYDVDYDKFNENWYKRRQVMYAPGIDKIPGSVGNWVDSIISPGINKGIQGLSEGFNKATSAYNRLVTGIADKAGQVSKSLLQGYKDYSDKHPYHYNSSTYYGKRF